MKPAREPGPRSGGNMAYDAARKLHILFGSQFSNDPHTWAYDLAKNEWRDLAPPTMPPTDSNDCVLTYDSINRVIIAVIKVSEGKDEAATHRLETWSFDAGANEWKKMNPEIEPDPTGSRARNLSSLRSSTSPCSRIGPTAKSRTNSKSGPIASLRRSPRRVPAEAQPNRAGARSRASWKILSFRSSRQRGPNCRGKASRRRPATSLSGRSVEVLTEDQLTRSKERTPPLAEPSVGAIKRVAQPASIEGEPIHERAFTPEQLDASGKPYRFGVHAYRVRAVNEAGVESGPSPACFTIPSAPQSVFCREEGESAQLAWAAPASGARAYRVYRMNGRFNKEPLPRLTPEPIAALTFTDPEAGESTRRYHIVAVDALGQEGFPSAPVWFKREWQQFYEPFSGPWHQ